MRLYFSVFCILYFKKYNFSSVYLTMFLSTLLNFIIILFEIKLLNFIMVDLFYFSQWVARIHDSWPITGLESDSTPIPDFKWNQFLAVLCELTEVSDCVSSEGWIAIFNKKEIMFGAILPIKSQETEKSTISWTARCFVQ